MMRWLLVLLVGCGGVKSDPSADDWSGALTDFATARCQWEYDCQDRHDDTCVDDTVNIETNGMAMLDVAQCISCLHAWTAVYGDLACHTNLTFAQAQSLDAACDPGHTGENFAACETEDLPGPDPT